MPAESTLALNLLRIPYAGGEGGNEIYAEKLWYRHLVKRVKLLDVKVDKSVEAGRVPITTLADKIFEKWAGTTFAVDLNEPLFALTMWSDMRASAAKAAAVKLVQKVGAGGRYTDAMFPRTGGVYTGYQNGYGTVSLDAPAWLSRLVPS